MANGKTTRKTPILYWLTLTIMFVAFTLIVAEPILA
jgi:hypothetical protein